MIKTISNFLLIIGLLLASFKCQTDSRTQKQKTFTIKEVFQTERNETDNIDSPAIWHGPNQQNWIISTAKKTDVLVVNDASDGKFLQRIGASGTNPGCFKRPNGIFVIDSLALVVERDNHRVQVMTLPNFKSLGFIGDSLLVKPYGLFACKSDSSQYSLFVTDCYDSGDDVMPPDRELGKRVHHYHFTTESNDIKWQLVRTFGDTTGKGVLRVVESIFGDPVNNCLLLAEEDTLQTSVKVYDFNGKFTGKTFGEGLFKQQVEGITLYQNQDGSGYWIITDQDHQHNQFLVFDRINFSYLGSFSGTNTTNTDGVWLTQTATPQFPSGAFYAVHDDGNVSAFDWRVIADSLKVGY